MTEAEAVKAATLAMAKRKSHAEHNREWAYNPCTHSGTVLRLETATHIEDACESCGAHRFTPKPE
jgi:hypothetical protein